MELKDEILEDLQELKDEVDEFNEEIDRINYIARNTKSTRTLQYAKEQLVILNKAIKDDTKQMKKLLRQLKKYED